MIARPGHRGAELSESGLDALADSGLALGLASSLTEALQSVAEAAARAVGADAVIARVADDAQLTLIACSVATTSAAVAAELEGSRLPLADVPESEETELQRLPETVRLAAARVGAEFVVLLPVHVDGRIRGSLELIRRAAFDDGERRLARLAAAQAALAIRAFGGNGTAARGPDTEALLSLAGDALAAGADESRTADQVPRLAAEATGAVSGLLWRREPAQPSQLELVSSFGPHGTDPTLARAEATAEKALASREGVVFGVLEGEGGLSATLQLGEPPIGALQLLFAPEDAPAEKVLLAVLPRYGVRAAHALRASLHSRTVALELERTRALLAVVGQAISQLSLSHTLETAVARVA